MLPAKLEIHCHVLKWIKILHVFCNLVLMAVAAGVLYLTIKARTQVQTELNLLWRYENVNVEVMLAAAVLLITISALGVMSLYQLSFNVLLTVLAALLLFLLATVNYSIAIGVLADYTTKGPLFIQLRHEYDRYKNHSGHIDDLQFTLSCCGLKSYLDLDTIPPSCCKGVTICNTYSPAFQSNGCFESLRNMIIHYAWTIVIGLGFMSILEVNDPPDGTSSSNTDNVPINYILTDPQSETPFPWKDTSRYFNTVINSHWQILADSKLPLQIIAIATTYVLCRMVKISRQQNLQEAAVKIPRVRSNSSHGADPENAEAPAPQEKEKPAEEESSPPKADPVPVDEVKETTEAGEVK